MAIALTKLEKQLALAWELRLDQALESCREVSQQMGIELGIEARALSEKTFQNYSLEETPIVAEYVLLVASLYRADGQLEESRELIRLVEKVFNSRSLSKPLQLYLQKGNTCLMDGDFTEALDHFLRATKCNASVIERICAHGNLVYCLENLGLPYENAVKELQLLFAKVPPDKCPDLRAQFETMTMRSLFRNGQIKEIFEKSVDRQVSQKTHLRFWISELPYHAYYSTFSDADKETYLLQNPSFYKKAYRLRTFHGILHPADLEGFRGSDFCDRLYLWTWRWLVSPEEFSLDKVLWLLQKMSLQTLSPKLTAEDYQLLHNAFMWISLFVPSEAGTLKKLAGSIFQKPRTEYPIFDFEAKTLEYFHALQVGDKGLRQLKALQKHSLWESSAIYFKQLALSLFDEKVEVPQPVLLLSQRLKQICATQKMTERHTVSVDLIHYRISWKSGKETVLSEPMAMALDLLSRKECVDYAEFVWVCFGFRRFDSFIHNAKIYNLLARIKNTLPSDLKLRTKNNKIYAIGSWNSVQFIRPIGGAAAIQRQTEWLQGSLKEAPPKSSNITQRLNPACYLAETPGKSLLTRKELEALTGKSKSTASRLIAQWLGLGIVKKMGSAKNTKYLLVSDSGLPSPAL